MNRAARRQQKRHSRKAASQARRQPSRAEGVAGRGAPALYDAQLIQKGFQLQMAGKAPEAAAVYRQILQADPNHADANHLLGILALQSGDLASAEDLISRAIATDGAQPMYHNNLGSVLGKLGRLEDAEKQLKLDAAEAVVDDFAELHGGASRVVAELKDRLHRFGFYLERLARAQQRLGEFAAYLELADDHFDLTPLVAFLRLCGDRIRWSGNGDPEVSSASIRGLQLTLDDLLCLQPRQGITSTSLNFSTRWSMRSFLIPRPISRRWPE